jgi:hypothetical protein
VVENTGAIAFVVGIVVVIVDLAQDLHIQKMLGANLRPEHKHSLQEEPTAGFAPSQDIVVGTGRHAHIVDGTDSLAAFVQIAADSRLVVDVVQSHSPQLGYLFPFSSVLCLARGLE